MIYSIHYTPRAINDLDKVVNYIEQELFSPTSAERFAQGIFTVIDRLKFNAGVFAISAYKDVLRYNIAARHVLYKGFAIIYSIHGNAVVVHRVMHGSLVKG
jgi:plasmid stabilization system protein ParE